MHLPDCKSDLDGTHVLKVMLTNINGLSSKVNVLAENIKDQHLDVICVTETHLLSHLSSSIVSIPNYSLVRHDVDGQVYKHGVCCYIHNRLMFDSFSQPLPNLLSFRLTSFNVFVLLVYRAPSNSEDTNKRISSFILDFCGGKEVIILGDFNLPSIDWSSPMLHCPPLERMFLDTFLTVGLHQWVTEATYPKSGNTLDLVLTSESDRMGTLVVMPPLPGCDHCAISFDYIFSFTPSDVPFPGSLTTQRDWHKGRYKAAGHKLSSIDWDLELAYLNTDQSFKRFSSIIQKVTAECIPPKPAGAGKPPWSTRPPNSLIHRRQSAWSRYKAVRGQLGRHSVEARDCYAGFARLNQQCRSYAVKAQARYEEDLILRSQEQPKLFHSYVRKKKTSRPTVGPLRMASGELSDDASRMSELFAEAFSSVFSRTIPDNPHPHQQFHDTSLSITSVTQESVLNMLLDIDGNTAMGPDEIHPLLLKNCATQLAYPLTLIFNRSLRDGALPSDWKTSLVVPIFKKGPRYEALNYRPISLTSVPCKLMERLLCNSLVPYLETHDLLNPHQFGFRTGRSTMDQLLLVYDSVSKQVDKGAVSDVILFDFSKAFDVVVHSLMIEKLSNLGIQGNILKWITSFLVGRSMRVCVKGQASQPKPVLSGVPQGSVLGPILFLIYVNSIASQLKSSYKIFADDLKMYACVQYKTQSDPHSPTCQDVQEDIDALHKTALSWGLSMNVQKSVVLRFARHHSTDLPEPSYILNGNQIPVQEKATDLGVIVDVSLKFHGHVQSVAHKAGGLAENLLKSTVCRTPRFMLLLLTTHIRPILEYCSCVWNTGYVQDIYLLERVQRRWTKHIDGMEGFSYGERLKALDLYSVQGRLLRADLIQYWKILNGHSCISASDLFQRPPHSRTRGHRNKVFPPIIATDLRKRCFSIRCIPLWNSLPADAACAPNVTHFKRALDTCMRDKLFSYPD